MPFDHFETNAIRGQMKRTEQQEHSAPLFLTSSFVFPDPEQMEQAFEGGTADNIYSRYSNPNTDELIRKTCAMEGAEDGFALRRHLLPILDLLTENALPQSWRL